MRILGFLGSNHGYIVEVSRAEMGQITANYAGSGYYAQPRDLHIGNEIEIGRLWEQLTALHKRQQTLMNTVSALRGLATALESFDPIVATAVEVEEN